MLLHRHAMDVIASALEASEWGLDTYGLGAYAQMSPTNSVMAVAGYWIERTAAMLDFEARHPGRCLRLRYEDLVTRTDESMEEVWRLFGVDGSVRCVDAFAGQHDPLAPSDHKIWHTHSVHAASIGRGPASRPIASTASRARCHEPAVGHPGLRRRSTTAGEWGRRVRAMASATRVFEACGSTGTTSSLEPRCSRPSLLEPPDG